MKMNTKLEEAFNDQVTLEFQASMVYRQLAIEMDRMDLPGIAAWLRHQADEEIVHANKFIDHLTDRDNRACIGAIPEPKVEINSVLDAFEAAYAHEKRVSESIRGLYRASETEDDLDSRPLLTEFLTEQVEEEATVSEILGRVRLINNDGSGLLRIDDELGRRPAGSTESSN